jgi:hypothetical protein
MSIRSKAAVETLKTLGAFIAGGVAFYFILDILGPTVGLILMLVSLVGWFTWLVYDYYVHMFTLKDKWKL